MQSHLAAMDTSETTQCQTNAAEARGLPKAAAFVLDCLANLPEAFLVALGQPILLQPFNEVSKTVLECASLLLAWTENLECWSVEVL